jgi:hypothetical protein
MALSKKVLLSLMLLSHGDNRSKLNFDQKIKAAFHKNQSLFFLQIDDSQKTILVKY